MKLPKWLEIRFETLLNAFGNESFNYEKAAGVLVARNKDDEKNINVILSELRKKGFLKVEFDPDDARKRIYQLVSKEEMLKNIVSKSKSELSRSDLENLLKKAADLIRTRVDYTFILVLLFYKRISDKWEQEFNDALKEALEDGFSKKDAMEEASLAMYHRFDMPKEFLWNEIRKSPAILPENFSKAMKSIAERNIDLRDVFETIDFIHFTSNRENAEILRQLVELFSSVSFADVSSDILGDAYEWILRYFAPQKAKEGEVYTPREVIQLLVEILNPQSEESVYDPAVGSSGMLITSFQHLLDLRGKSEAEKLFLYGQEANPKTLALSKMNIYIHDIINHNLALGDTLLYPKFKDENSIKRFDVVIANPAWNQDGYGQETIKKGEFVSQRFPFGFAPKQYADWMWIQHMHSSSKENSGRVGIIIDNGALFRGGKEGAIRRQFISNNFIDTAILLPEKLFYNTGAPGTIIILKRQKSPQRKGKILFINASDEYEAHPDVRKLNRLGEESIKKISETYLKTLEIEGFSRLVDFKVIEENDFNLNVSLYVYKEDKIEEINIGKEWMELKRLEGEINDIDEKIEEYLKELEYVGDYEG